MTTSYAKRTKIPVSQSQGEAMKLIQRFGADDFVQGILNGREFIVFKLDGSTYRFDVPPSDDERERRRLWRVLVMLMKAKLVACEEMHMSPMQAFAGELLLPNGNTVAQCLEANKGTLLDLPLMLPEGGGA